MSKSERRKPTVVASERRFRGIPVSPGIGIGPLFITTENRPEIPRRRIASDEVATQLARLDAAIRQSRRQLAKLKGRLVLLPEDSQAEISPLIDAYLKMLGPSRLVRGAQRRVESLLCAEAAMLDECEAIATALLDGERDQMLVRQAEEVREIGRRVVRNLTQTPFRSFAAAPQGAILVAEWLRPSDAALLDPAKLAGVATDEGGAEGHTAVMLRALGIPAVLAAAGIAGATRPGLLAVIDGGAGEIVLSPSTATMAEARKRLAAHAREGQKLARLRRLPAETTDHQAVELQANMELPNELPLISKAGASGIGLLRTEFLFMNRASVPDEEAQTETYRSVIEAMAGDPVTIRVLDWGGEKEIDSLETAGVVPPVTGDNPALGLRGIRLLLRETDVFETQLAAILRAANAGPVRVLLPMVTTLAEVRAARETYDRVARRLRRRGERVPDPLPPMGVMIETPGAALSADAIVLESDFFAIGTNDLTMYTLAVDRSETDLSHLYDPLHPSVLRLMQLAVEAALRVRKPVSVCGEIAGNPKMAPLLIGLGVRSLSMNPSAVPRVKQAVRSVSMAACIRFARHVMDLHDPAAVVASFAEFEEA